MSDASNIQGDPDLNTDADTASGGAPDEPDLGGENTPTGDTTDPDDVPADNPSGG